MLPIPPQFTLNASQRTGAFLREIAPRVDRIPADDRVDLPEIQESFRVSFSEEARAQASTNPPDRQPNRPEGLIQTGVEAYRRVAAL